MNDYTCSVCGVHFTKAELAELKDMDEEYHLENGSLICPDCWDRFQRKDLEDQFDKLMEVGATMDDLKLKLFKFTVLVHRIWQVTYMLPADEKDLAFDIYNACYKVIEARGLEDEYEAFLPWKQKKSEDTENDND